MAKLLKTTKLCGDQIEQQQEEQSSSTQIMELTEEDEKEREEEGRKYLYVPGYDWKAWVSKANSLRKSALILWTAYMLEEERLDSLGEAALGQSFELGHEDTAMMLIGMAIENLLKGILIARDSSLIENGKTASRLKTHDLTKLITWAGISIDKYDTQLCALLSDFITWQGRYPVPLESSAIRGLFRAKYDWKTLDNLFVRILKSVSEGELAEADRAFSSKVDKVREAFFKKDNSQNSETA